MQLSDDGHGISADSLAFYRDNRHRLGPITAVSVTFPGLDRTSAYPLTLRDNAGNQMRLSGATAGYPGEGPRTAMQILVEAGFDAEHARDVFTRKLVQLRRDHSGATRRDDVAAALQRQPVRRALRPAHPPPSVIRRRDARPSSLRPQSSAPTRPVRRCRR
jgi:hypothetical protein